MNAKRNKANKRARDEKAAREAAEEALRAEKARQGNFSLHEAKQRLARLGEQNDAYGDALVDAKRAKDEAAATKERYNKVADQVEQMPTWRPVVGKGSGRGRAKTEWGTRVIIYSMLAMMCPAASVGAIIVNIVRRTAPWLNPVAPTPATVREMRFELRIVEETLAGRRVAAAARVRQLGFDETTKFQDPSMVTSVLIEPTVGAKPENAPSPLTSHISPLTSHNPLCTVRHCNAQRSPHADAPSDAASDGGCVARVAGRDHACSVRDRRRLVGAARESDRGQVLCAMPQLPRRLGGQ
eukprot:135865-Prymnesium_polylepis.1